MLRVHQHVIGELYLLDYSTRYMRLISVCVVSLELMLGGSKILVLLDRTNLEYGF